MKKQKITFETKLEELDEILLSLKKGDLNLKEITTKIKFAKEIYSACKEELEEAKLVISEIKAEAND